MSKELDEFNTNINNELPLFSEKFLSVGKSYSKVMIAASNYDDNSTQNLRDSSIEFRDSIESSMEGCANLIREVMKWPPINYNFNKSKRDTEIILKNLVKEMLDGLLLIDEAVGL